MLNLPKVFHSMATLFYGKRLAINPDQGLTQAGPLSVANPLHVQAKMTKTPLLTNIGFKVITGSVC